MDEIDEELFIKGPGTFEKSHWLHMTMFRHEPRYKRLAIKFEEEHVNFERKWVENWY